MPDSFKEDRSIYLQIKEMIENEILKDILLEEEQVPSTTELSKFYKINPATAAKGINLLVDEGILYKKRGIGMFVQTGAKQQIKQSRRRAFYDSFVRALIEEAKALDISKEELIRMIEKTGENAAD